MDENGQQSKAALGKTEISLTLSNKYEVPIEEKADIQSVVIRWGFWFYCLTHCSILKLLTYC